MSRSYRKPYVVDGYGTCHKKYSKNYANRVIRRKNIEYEIANGRFYKKINNSWDICDYKWRYNKHPTIRFWKDKFELVEPDPLWWYNRK